MIRAAIEIAEQSDREQLLELVASAYSLSREGAVVLLLNGIDRADVDRLLDPVVAVQGVAVSGVLYMDAADDRAAQAARDAVEVITSTERLCARLRADGIPALFTGITRDESDPALSPFSASAPTNHGSRLAV